ncbi:MAG: hypothetical protein ABI624_15795 [Casimicrobiaceae bacterium]
MKPATAIAIAVFALVALLQLLRVALGWDITVNGVSVPIWFSVVACIVAAALAFMLARDART